MRGGVEIVLVGGLVVRGPGGGLDGAALGGRRAEVAFARLALDCGRVVSRDALSDAIWGERLPGSWRPALRNVVAGVRRGLAVAGLAEVLLRSAGDGYRLDLPPGCTVDVVVFAKEAERAERSARQGDHESASRIASEALAAASLPVLLGAEGEWVEGVRRQVGELRLRLERTSGDAALALGDTAEAERLAHRLIAAAPLREDAHRLLIRSLYAAGNRAEALWAYDACRRRLRDELGVMPSPPTAALFLEILAEEREEYPVQEVERRGAPAAGPLLLIAQQSAFVGRATVLERLFARLRLAREAGPFVVAVSGEAGLGKTSLAAQLAGRAHAAGVTVLYGRADDRIAVPYRSLLEALQSGLAAYEASEIAGRLGDHAGALGRLLPSLAGAAGPSPPTGLQDLDQLRVERAIVHALRVIAGEHGALLVLDDMQWASRLEISALEAIARGPASLELLVLALHRDADEPAGLRALGEYPRVERLALEPLSVDEVAELVRLSGVDASAGAPLDVAANVWRLSGGSPLLASELLRSWADGEHPRGVRIAELVRERIVGLPASAEEVLRTAAVAGLEFDPQVVAAASTVETSSALAALDPARRAGLLVPATQHPGWLAFRHALVRSSLLDALEPAARLRLHERLGSVLEAEAQGDRNAFLTLAYHFGAAAPLGDWRRTLRYGLPVARGAYEAGVYEDVIAVATRTLAALHNAGDPDPPARLDLEIMLGGSHRALGEPRGHQTLQGAFAAARELGDPERMADAALAFSDAGAASEEAFIDDVLLGLYEEALEALDAGDSHRRARLLGHLASAYAWRQSGAAGQRAAEQALVLARELGDSATLARVLTTARRSRTGSGQLAEQERLESELSELAVALDDPGQRVRTAMWRFETSVERGRGEELERLLGVAGENVGELRMGNYHHSLAYTRAALALLRGRIDQADLLVERAVAVGLERGVDAMIVQAIRMIQLMGVRHEQGRLGELREELAAFFAQAGVPEWLGAVAFVDGELGRHEEVGENLDAILSGFAAGGARLVTPIGFVAHMAAPIARLADADRAAALYEIILPFAGQGAYFSYFAGPIDYHLGLLARTLERERDVERHLAAAVAFCERLRAPLWQDRCRAAFAAHQSAGRRAARRTKSRAERPPR